MDILLTLLIFLGLTGVFALLGLNVWVWPKAAIDRVTASAGDPQAAHAVAHPSLAFRDLLKKLGTLVPASPKDTTVMQRRLIRAGFRNSNALKVLYGAKFVLAILVPLLTFGVIAGSAWESSSSAPASPPRSATMPSSCACKPARLLKRRPPNSVSSSYFRSFSVFCLRYLWLRLDRWR